MDSADPKKPTQPPDPLDNRDEDIEFFTMTAKNDPEKEIGIVSAPADTLPLMPSQYSYTTRDKTVIRDLVKIDNKQQFLTALYIAVTPGEDKAAREAIAAYAGEILDRLAGQATRGEPIDYQYTSQIVAEAITKARAAGINSPYIDALEEMQTPAPPPDTTPNLFPDLPPNTAEKKPSAADIVTVQQAKILAADAKARYPAPPYVRPEVVNIPTANLARNIHTADRAANPGGIFRYPVDKRPHSHHVFMALLDKIGEQYPIAPIDKNILISLGNLYAQRKAAGALGKHGGAIITAADIIRLYRGYDAQTTIEEAEIQAIQDRIEKLRNINVSFDFTQHFQYNNVGDEVELSIPDTMRRPISESEARTAPANMVKRAGGLTVVRFSYTGHMIDARVIEVEYSNGTVITAFELLTPPIVYEYAEKIRQIQQVETKLLDIRKRANSTRDGDIIKIYLLEQINAMRREKSTRAPRILLDTLFADLRIEITSRMLKKKKADIIKRILTHFRETPRKNGKPLITGFSEVIGRRRAVIGYDIQITPDDEDAKQ